ncbi:hypothetical protein [Fonticella tunisiensis]|uniref:Carboxypeptidase family protein n=1 Tax=Fonticella tunisiensis TaxID=1096341 RepID=A0A4R7KUI0_9CLOT|nr:hypothetical protein [Fonticella tunisiensis]TDT61649.1 hypothetical protein EDD71_106133 [Fonticella tunisiensis]
MKAKLTSLVLAAAMMMSLIGCEARETNSGNVQQSSSSKQKVVVVVVDKKTKAPVKDAKVYVVGNETAYITDEMGKTKEIEVDLNKGYFERYSDEVKKIIRSGFLSIVVVKEGYGKHLEMDYCIYPGSSISIVKAEISSGTKHTVNYNKPDVSYIENLVKSYEKYEGQGNNAGSMVKYKIAVKDQNNRPLEGVKIVIPEIMMSTKTDKKGLCEFEVPYDKTTNDNYPVKKEYGEITILAYKEGYAFSTVLGAHVKQGGKDNSAQIKMKQSKNFKVDYSLCEPDEEWINLLMNYYK